MCPCCDHPIDDHDQAGICLACAKVSRRCPGPGSPAAIVTIHIAKGTGLVAGSMPGVTTASYAAMRVAEALGMDPNARDWFLYDPVSRRPLSEREVVAAYHGRVLSIAWTEEHNR